MALKPVFTIPVLCIDNLLFAGAPPGRTPLCTRKELAGKFFHYQSGRTLMRTWPKKSIQLYAVGAHADF